MNNNLILPMIVFLIAFICIIILLIIIRNKRKQKFKQTIEELDYEKASRLLLEEFRSGKLGRLTLEFPQE